MDFKNSRIYVININHYMMEFGIRQMLQYSKVIKSRDIWKQKAVQRSNEIRKYRKIKKHYQEKIAALKTQIKSMKQTAEVKKTAQI